MSPRVSRQPYLEGLIYGKKERILCSNANTKYVKGEFTCLLETIVCINVVLPNGE